MGRLRTALFEPSSRYDHDSRWGLVGGLVQAGLHLVGFGALFVLSILLGVVEPAATASGATAAFWVVVVAGAVLGAGMVGLAELERIDRFWRTVAGRLVTVVVLYAAFWGLLAAVGLDAVFAALAFVVARGIAHVWRVRRAKR